MADWDTKLHTIYETHKSIEKKPSEGQIIIAEKIGTDDRKQVIRTGDELHVWSYHYVMPGMIRAEVFCNVDDDYVWRGCGGFDF
jgi:hypothetical protein